MDINTGKLAGSSTFFQKKIREVESGVKVAKESKIKDSLHSKILSDFNDVKYSDRDFKTRIIENNNRLTNYENELSKIQYMEQRLEEIESLDVVKDKAEIVRIVDESIYDNKNVFDGYINSGNSLEEDIKKVKEYISSNYGVLENEFKAIEIASQNILSLSPSYSQDSIEEINFADINSAVNVMNVNKKRLMDLIS
ncbi:MAG TPA: hypothetical protein PK385_04330 [Spirochaetota bacterium]|mgnify:CR=1 FL=1|nr:MAG: hypothetical protein BWX91_02000 [Spirochaetes bacterium ADurb.Bin133]HNZ25906.1 hypothetical protein [Spirochaetota bacterium]HOF00042.1 hypothetical protein [Spirochaetota bacterium]HOS31964.1 hypothetical protein [Spirochaetota bacterium]HOS55266.1 hypothetical protein [Spirochaetota bacterium]